MDTIPRETTIKIVFLPSGRGLLYKERIFSQVEQILSFYNRLFSEGDFVCRKVNRKSSKLPPLAENLQSESSPFNKQNVIVTCNLL